MANRLYNPARQSFLEGGIAYLTDTIRLVLVGAGYVPDTTTDQFLSSIPAGQRIATSSPLIGKTSTNGIANAAAVVYPPLSGPLVMYLVLYQDTGSDASSRLIALWDSAVNLPFMPNGGTLTVKWDTDANNGIFKL